MLPLIHTILEAHFISGTAFVDNPEDDRFKVFARFLELAARLYQLKVVIGFSFAKVLPFDV